MGKPVGLLLGKRRFGVLYLLLPRLYLGKPVVYLLLRRFKLRVGGFEVFVVLSLAIRQRLFGVRNGCVEPNLRPLFP